MAIEITLEKGHFSLGIGGGIGVGETSYLNGICNCTV